MLSTLPLDNILNILSYLSLDAVTYSILPISHYFWDNREIFYKEIYFNAVYCCFHTIDLTYNRLHLDKEIQYKLEEYMKPETINYGKLIKRYNSHKRMYYEFLRDIGGEFFNVFIDILKENKYDVRIKNLSLCGTSVEFKRLNELPNLTSLRLGESFFNNLENLSPLTNLTTLDLSSIRYVKPYKGSLSSWVVTRNESISLEGLKTLVNLKELILSHAPLIDHGRPDFENKNEPVLKPISGLTNLTKLDISFTHVYDLSPLKNMNKLKYLNFCWTDVVKIVNLPYLNHKTCKISYTGTPYQRIVNISSALGDCY